MTVFVHATFSEFIDACENRPQERFIVSMAGRATWLSAKHISEEIEHRVPRITWEFRKSEPSPNKA